MTELHWSQTVHHDGSPYYVSFDSTASHALLRLRLRVSKTAPITQVFVRTIPDGEQHLAPMHIVASHAQFNWWQTEIHLHRLRTNYRFFFHTSEGNWSFTANGMVQYMPTDATDFKFYIAIRPLPGYRTVYFIKYFLNALRTVIARIMCGVANILVMVLLL